MKTFEVEVQKRLFCLGTVKVIANTKEEAISQIQDRIDEGKLQTTKIDWTEPEYEYCSFETTGEAN